MIEIIITENQGGQRLDRFLKKYFDKAPLSLIYKMIRKDVKVNGKRSTKEAMIQAGDRLAVYLSEEEAKALQFQFDRTVLCLVTTDSRLPFNGQAVILAVKVHRRGVPSSNQSLMACSIISLLSGTKV